ncbi:hypothetical protein DB88DRAFT_470589 [Papiliotrema laurentii]|uniref:Uncharacterized protein n=1 Tax=Papiliotrema laurentii TaxID=5418 RepID=A0AAD9FXF4_PAPLA|nr:hypothetical protein DB88DRAFT_470589 [Papiliotrema laurentii]
MSTMEIHTDIGSVITSLGLTEADTGKLREFDREVRGVDGGNIAYLTVDSDSGFWSLQTERDDLIRYSYMNRRQEGSKQVKQWRSFVIKEGAILERAGDKWRQALSSLRVGEGESVHGMEEYPTLPMEVVEALCAAVAVTRRSAWVDSEGGGRRSSTMDDVTKFVTEWVYKAANPSRPPPVLASNHKAEAKAAEAAKAEWRIARIASTLPFMAMSDEAGSPQSGNQAAGFANASTGLSSGKETLKWEPRSAWVEDLAKTMEGTHTVRESVDSQATLCLWNPARPTIGMELSQLTEGGAWIAEMIQWSLNNEGELHPAPTFAIAIPEALKEWAKAALAHTQVSRAETISVDTRSPISSFLDSVNR